MQSRKHPGEIRKRRHFKGHAKGRKHEKKLMTGDGKDRLVHFSSPRFKPWVSLKSDCHAASRMLFLRQFGCILLLL
jgi:hypothetical protein